MSLAPKVLVVDDTPNNVKLLADLLGVKGYAVATAANGEEALAKLVAEKPDIVLLDVMMPIRLRCLPPDPRRSGDRTATGRAGDVARSDAGAHQGHRSRRG